MGSKRDHSDCRIAVTLSYNTVNVRVIRSERKIVRFMGVIAP